MKATDFLEKPEGWDYFPLLPDLDSFVMKEDGIQLTASLHKDIMHVSVSPLRSCQPTLSDDEHAILLLKNTPRILIEFFGENRSFQRMPDDPKRPTLNHYFSKVDK